MSPRNVLMVEGPDDEHVVKHICGTRGLGEISGIKSYGGIDLLLEAIEVRLKESDIFALGVLVDADTDQSARWQSICARLIRSGYDSMPDELPRNGLVLEPPSQSLLPRLGVWMMPDNCTAGILEDFLAFLVPSDDKLYGYLQTCLNELDPALIRFSSVKKPKVLIHSWLSYQEEPGRPFGQAISARYLDPDLPAASAFAEWLKRLFFVEQEAK